MIATLRSLRRQIDLRASAVVLVVLALAFLLGRSASPMWLGLLLAAGGAALVLARPALGLPGLVLAALVVPLEFGTGSEVSLNAATLLVPVLAAVWLLGMLLRRRIALTASPANAPLALFLAAGLLSLLIGRATWDPLIPMGDNFLLVQLAQWAIFAFSALAFWLGANLIRDERGLWRLTAVFLLAGGTLAILQAVPGVSGIASRFTTIALVRAPFWALLVSLAGGQLLFNRGLPLRWRVFLVLTLAAALAYAFVQQQEAASNWMGIGAALAALVWLRFPRLRWPVALAIVVMIALGVLFPAVYEFAGGDQEWERTGASRLVLIERVVDVTLRNPVTGLGPAGYRPYANAEPLLYGRAYWLEPQINSHNNYVDLFAHGGVLGLALFAWFAVALARSSLRLRSGYKAGPAAGYVNGMLAAGVASLVLMLLADWILPFVYNIGFPGFQAGVLVWLFLGGLVALDNVRPEDRQPAQPEDEQARRPGSAEASPTGT